MTERIEELSDSKTAVAQMLKTKQLNELDNIFTYHAPKNDQQERYVALRNKAKEFARLVIESCPHSREQKLAITAIQQACQWANASIAINE